MSDQKAPTILYVYHREVLVGEIERDHDLVFSFTYSLDWLKNPLKFALSLAMPLQEQSFGNKATLAFFENLLPEGDFRDALEKKHQIKSSFDFLREFGQDCAGALIVSAQKKSPYAKDEGGLSQVSIEEIYHALDQKRSVTEVISEIEPGYLSLAGAQDKFSAVFKGGQFYLPHHGRPTTHIVKVPIYRSGVKESVYNEYFCMQLAKSVGLNVAECEVLAHSKYPLYVTKRYDRAADSVGVIRRIHQQDFCQAQGVVSENKYEAKGGPSLLDNFELIKSNVAIAKRKAALFSYLDWVCFNIVTGNNDSHSKNLSFLSVNQKIELSPFYDLLCTAIYPKLNNKFSFTVGGRNDATKIGKNQLLDVDKNLGLKSGTMSERMRNIISSLNSDMGNLVEQVTDELPGAKIVNRISDLIIKRCKNIEKQGL